MAKWQTIKQISEKGRLLGIDAVLKLMEWCNKPNTASVTEEEARAYYDLLCARENSARPKCGENLRT